MASRLTLNKKKKYHPPFDDSGQEQNIDDYKTNKKHNMNLNQPDKSRTYAHIAKSPRKPNEPKCNIGITTQHTQKLSENSIDTHSNKTYAQISRDSNNTNTEDEIFSKAKSNAQKHKIKLKAG